jgi:RNA polymerase sigma-70 factor (ECF subfamily)
VALKLPHGARRDARVDAAGDLILLEDQDRTRCDRRQIAQGCARLELALRRGGRVALLARAAKS